MTKAYNYINESIKLTESVGYLINEHFRDDVRRTVISENIYEWGMQQLRKKQLNSLIEEGIDSFDFVRDNDFERYCRLQYEQAEAGYDLARLYILGDFIPEELRGIVDNPNNHFDRSGYHE